MIVSGTASPVQASSSNKLVAVRGSLMRGHGGFKLLPSGQPRRSQPGLIPLSSNAPNDVFLATKSSALTYGTRRIIRAEGPSSLRIRGQGRYHEVRADGHLTTARQTSKEHIAQRPYRQALLLYFFKRISPNVNFSPNNTSSISPGYGRRGGRQHHAPVDQPSLRLPVAQ